MPQPTTTARRASDGRSQRFAIKAKLGSGGIGEVFLAEDDVLKRQVALKVIRREHSLEADFQKRLLHEAERASQLNDQHIARIYDVAEHEGRPCIIMEYVEGHTLRAKLREPLATEEFFSIGEQCLEAVAFAHRHGVLHCDLKPENLMVTPAGLVKVLDFGFARRLRFETNDTQDSLELSSTSIGGTLAYIAPEVLLGTAPDQRADIFSIGVVLYEALTGTHPFREPQPDVTGQILREQPRPIAGPILAGLDLVLLRMLAKDPTQRYQTCADALADLRAVHAGQKPALGKGRRTTRPGLRSPLTLPLAAVLVLGALLLSWPPISRHPAQPATRVLVVLPFQPAGADSSDLALANGLTETLTAKLGQIADRYPVETVAASETRAQKAKVRDPQQARTVLGATLVLEGSLQQVGGTVRVIYSLVDTRSLRQVHSGVITAAASNPFAVQDRVLEEVLNSLDIELATGDQKRMASHGTTQAQAYDSYLRGRGYLHEFDRPENLDNAIAAFQASLKQDSRFALAYAGLGQAYLKKYAITHLPESVAQANDACAHAVDLGGGPDGEICLGMLFNTTGQYQDARRHLERAVEIDSTSDESYRELALAYEGLQRLNDAENSLKRAIALRPRYWAGYRRLGWFYAEHGGRYDEAAQQFKLVVDLAPDSFSGYSNLGAVYELQGKYAEAIKVLEQSIAIRPTPKALSNLGVAYFYLREYQDAARVYEQAAQMTPNDSIVFGNLAEAYGQIQGKQEESRRCYVHALQLAEQGLSVNDKDGRALSYAALYAARLGQHEKAERYRKAAGKLSARDPQVRKNSALVLAQFHQDKQALAELDQAVREGLAASEITNDPLWQRFATHPRYVAIMATARKE